jgi:hypothetical protein
VVGVAGCGPASVRMAMTAAYQFARRDGSV